MGKGTSGEGGFGGGVFFGDGLGLFLDVFELGLGLVG